MQDAAGHTSPKNSRALLEVLLAKEDFAACRDLSERDETQQAAILVSVPHQGSPYGKSKILSGRKDLHKTFAACGHDNTTATFFQLTRADPAQCPGLSEFRICVLFLIEYIRSKV